MSGVLEGIIDRNVNSILSMFVKDKSELFHLQKVSKLSGVPIATSFRIVRRLVSLGFVAVIKVGKFKVYKIAENKKTKVLVGLLGK